MPLVRQVHLDPRTRISRRLGKPLRRHDDVELASKVREDGGHEIDRLASREPPQERKLLEPLARRGGLAERTQHVAAQADPFGDYAGYFWVAIEAEEKPSARPVFEAGAGQDRFA